MLENSNPCVEFVISKEGANYVFHFLPGNVTDLQPFNALVSSIYKAYSNHYFVSVGEYMHPITTENGLRTISVNQTQVPNLVRIVLEISTYKNLSVKVKGLDESLRPADVVINIPTDAKKSTAVIPYYNKRNNNMTTRRK